MPKSRQQKVEDALWSAPIVLVMLAYLSFRIVQNDIGRTVGWGLYGLGWALVIAGYARLAAKRRRPGAGGVLAVVFLGAFGLLFWANHG
ncbi:hypothetical protein [Streptomyces paromomycinus]|uniref:Uncharacterized protein n=1 Tax=Streptomyces paromomycinus TaxID=92743 RepID=A0A401WBL5_STREY|nr:hypothetical protein [Streptomyces paromomycinus]GCD46697.1 hypothetical protein GKJPGBOP_06448 [Streptomyces paromomycinus]